MYKKEYIWGLVGTIIGILGAISIALIYYEDTLAAEVIKDFSEGDWIWLIFAYYGPVYLFPGLGAFIGLIGTIMLMMEKRNGGVWVIVGGSLLLYSFLSELISIGMFMLEDGLMVSSGALLLMAGIMVLKKKASFKNDPEKEIGLTF